jgi:hypothetical protein
MIVEKMTWRHSNEQEVFEPPNNFNRGRKFIRRDYLNGR